MNLYHICFYSVERSKIDRNKDMWIHRKNKSYKEKLIYRQLKLRIHIISHVDMITY